MSDPSAQRQAKELNSVSDGAGKPRLLNVRELAAFRGIHEKTVYPWAERGELPCIRLGNRIRFRVEDLDRWLAHRKEK